MVPWARQIPEINVWWPFGKETATTQPTTLLFPLAFGVVGYLSPGNLLGVPVRVSLRRLLTPTISFDSLLLSPSFAPKEGR